jgi:hypothetical protein
MKDVLPFLKKFLNQYRIERRGNKEGEIDEITTESE